MLLFSYCLIIFSILLFVLFFQIRILYCVNEVRIKEKKNNSKYFLKDGISKISKEREGKKGEGGRERAGEGEGERGEEGQREKKTSKNFGNAGGLY